MPPDAAPSPGGDADPEPPLIVVVGPLVHDVTVRVDHLPPVGATARADEVLQAAGGKGGNPALTLARLGAQVRMVGAVGDDDEGRAVLRDLWEAGVDPGPVRVEGRTARIVHLVEDGPATRDLELPGIAARYVPDDDLLRDACAGASVVLVSTAMPEAGVRAAVARGRAEGALVVVDGAGPAGTTRSVLDGADVLRLDAEEASALVGFAVDGPEAGERAALALRGAPAPGVVVVQAGDGGDVVASPTGTLRLARLPVPTVDPTGAGDAFVAVLALLLACGMPLSASARLGSAAAAHTAGRLGARTAFSEVGELLDLLADAA